MGNMYNAKRCIYKDYKFASTYELRAAYILDKKIELGKIKSWDYPKYKFIKYVSENGKNRKYIIDFVIIDNNNNEFILEVKGRQTNNDLCKWQSAKLQGYNLIVWKYNDIKKYENQLGITNSEITNLILQCAELHNKTIKEYFSKRNKLEKYRETNPKCLYCGKEFVPRQLQQICCCKKHGYLYKQKGIKNSSGYCLYCNKEFIKIHGVQKYCCEEHRNLHYKKIIDENKKINCLYCGKEFIKNTNIQKYCCIEHQKLYYKKLKEEK